MSNAKDMQMPHKTFNLGGKDRAIKFDLNAFAELEKKYGTVEKAMEELQNGKVTTFRTLLWIGLIHEEAVIDPDTGDVIKYNITPYDVGSWIDAGTMKTMSSELMSALVESMPMNDKENPLDNISSKEVEAAIKNALTTKSQAPLA